MTRNARTQEELIGTLHARAEAEGMLRAPSPVGHPLPTPYGAEEPYRSLVEQMPEGAVVLSSSGEILYANARFASLVGEPLQSMSGSRFDRFVEESDRSDVSILLGAGSGRRGCRLLGRDSGPLEVSLSLTTTASVHGDLLNLIVTDVRELLEAHRSSDHAMHDSHMKDRFLAVLAHELRNPLGTIVTAVQVLKAARDEGRPAIVSYDVITRQVAHMSRLIDDLLDIEQVVSGKLCLNRQPFDLAEVVRRAVATLLADPRLDRKISVTVEPVWVDVDAVRIAQVLDNIMANAIKYTPPGGRIQLALRADGDEAVLSVEDSGFGIAPSLLPFIFDMYVQADTSPGRARSGLGIGLALVRRLVELHGGTVAASSDGEGHGSTFTVRLSRIPSADIFSDAFPPPERRVKPRRVLLMEGSGEAREMLRQMLEASGHAVFAAADAIRGIELVRAVRPHVAIIDLSLPRTDGYEVARRLREHPDGRGMLLIALTDRGSSGDSRHSLEHGFDHHLVKHGPPDHLVRLISERA